MWKVKCFKLNKVYICLRKGRLIENKRVNKYQMSSELVTKLKRVI